MKKWIFRIFIGLFLSVFAIISAVFLNEFFDKTDVVKHIKNENLKTIKADWQGTPVDAKGRFVNYEFPFATKAQDILKWQFGKKPFANEKRNDAARLEIKNPKEFLQSEKDGVLWLGHASFFIRAGSVNILIDPVFGNPPLVRTFVEIPSPIEDLRKVDFVLLSHDHRDHCDENTLKAVTAKFPQAKILTGLRMDELLKSWIQPSNKIETAGWYQQFSLPENDLKITFLPTRHWARRGLFDTNRRLWGAFLIESAGRKIYFGADSGYGSHYKDLRETFGKIDIFIVGIGAYEPRWFMNSNHQSPEDAFRAFRDANAETLIPMHYGRFDLSDEPPSQPLKLLKSEAEKQNLSERIKALQINESFEF